MSIAIVLTCDHPDCAATLSVPYSEEWFVVAPTAYKGQAAERGGYTHVATRWHCLFGCLAWMGRRRVHP